MSVHLLHTSIVLTANEVPCIPGNTHTSFLKIAQKNYNGGILNGSINKGVKCEILGQEETVTQDHSDSKC